LLIAAIGCIIALKLMMQYNVLQISFSCITCPAIVVAYIGQAAYLRKFPQNVANTFYECIPGKLFNFDEFSFFFFNYILLVNRNLSIIFSPE